MINQRQRILQYIREFGYITCYDAYRDLGITQLGARIKELKNEGYNFRTETQCRTNRYGDKVNFVRYYLIDDLVSDNWEHIPKEE